MKKLLLLAHLLLSINFVHAQDSDSSENLDSAEEPARAPAPTLKPKIQKRPPKASSWIIVGGLGYHSTSKINFKNVSASGVLNTHEVSFAIGSAFEITAAAMYSEKDSWGAFGALTYQSKREIGDVDLGNGSFLRYTGGRPSIQLTLLEAGGLYRWSEFYIPLGFNYSIASYTDISDSSGTSTSLNGAMGFQAGAGYFLTDKICIEALIKMASISGKASTASVNLDYGTGNLTGLALQVRYIFW